MFCVLICNDKGCTNLLIVPNDCPEYIRFMICKVFPKNILLAITHFLLKQRNRNYLFIIQGLFMPISKYNIQNYSPIVRVVLLTQPQDILHVSLLQLQNPWHANPYVG